MPGSFDAFINCMVHIRESGRQWPEIKAEVGPNKLQLLFSLGRNNDRVFISGWGPFKSRPKYGSVLRGAATKGSWGPDARALGAADKAALWELMQKLHADPLSALGELGKELGWCVVCGRPLSNEESVGRGIGPVCWGRLTGAVPEIPF